MHIFQEMRLNKGNKVREFKTLEYGIFNILVAIIDNEVYFKTTDIKNILQIKDYDEYHKDT